MTEKEQDRSKSYYVQSVERALQILKVMHLKREDVGITELSREIQVGKSTIHRLITTLEEYGFVQQIRETGKYRIGWTLFEIGSEVPKRTGLIETAKPYLHSLCDQTNETTILAVRDGTDTIYIDKYETTQILRMDIQVGTRVPAYCTALGKTLLSGLNNNEIRELYKGQTFKSNTMNTVSSLDQLIFHIDNVRLSQYAIDDEEFSLGFRCVAAPIRDISGNIIAGIAVGGPSSRLTKSKLGEDYPLVMNAASRISTALGYKE
ncbi:MAG: IclR family transcriptional regulator [Dehalobacterium sp.]